MRTFLHVIIIFLAAALVVVLVAGCASSGTKKGGNDFGHAESTAMALAQQSIVDAEFEVQMSRKDHKDPLVPARLDAASRSHSAAVASIKNADKELAKSRQAHSALKAKTDESNQPYYKWLMYASFVSGVALSIGIAMLAIGTINGNKGAFGIGAGAAALGGSGIVVFLIMRVATPVMLWLAWGIGGVAFIAFVYFVIERFKARRQKLERTLINRDLVRKLPEEERQAVIDIDKTSDLSEPAQTLVKEVVAEDIRVESAAHATVEAAKETVEAIKTPTQ